MSLPTCPNRDQLSGYAQGTLPLEVAETVAAHLETCDDCESTLAVLERQEEPLLHDLRQPQPMLSELESPEYRRAMEAAEAAGEKGGKILSRETLGTAAEPSVFEPHQLGEYELLTKLGKGGMGTVYKARQVRLGKIVALKVLPKNRTNDPRAVFRFEREMQAIGRLSHPNIVQALDARDIEGTTVLVMEYVDGLDLAKIVKGDCLNFRVNEKGTVPFGSPVQLKTADACELVRQTAIGLQYIHQNGLVHRDIKPSNLMLTRQGQVKILDLGLALLGAGGLSQSSGKENGAAPLPDGELTSNGVAMGTPDYIAPEQAGDSHRVDIRADIYSLGCTLYHLLAGRAPFSGPNYKTPFDKVVAHARDTVPRLTSLNPSVPEELSKIVERMMDKDPSARFATPAEVAAALECFAARSDLTGLLAKSVSPNRAPTDAVHDRLPLASSPPWWRRRSTWIATAAIPLAVLLGIVIFIEFNGHFRYTSDPIPPPREETGASTETKKPLETNTEQPESRQPPVRPTPASQVPSATATSGFREDFEGSTLDVTRWAVGGRKVSWTPDDSGQWKWSHTLIRDPGDPNRYLCMDVQGPESGNSYGAIAWIRSTHNFNDKRPHVINFMWKADVTESHTNRYFIQVVDGDNTPTFEQDHLLDQDKAVRGITNLLWRNSVNGRVPGREYEKSSGKQQWSITIDVMGQVRLYDGPDGSGSLLHEDRLERSRAWYVRFLMYDGTSLHFGPGDSRLDLYSFDATNTQPVKSRPDQTGSGTQEKAAPSELH